MIYTHRKLCMSSAYTRMTRLRLTARTSRQISAFSRRASRHKHVQATVSALRRTYVSPSDVHASDSSAAQARRRCVYKITKGRLDLLQHAAASSSEGKKICSWRYRYLISTRTCRTHPRRERRSKAGRCGQEERRSVKAHIFTMIAALPI